MSLSIEPALGSRSQLSGLQVYLDSLGCAKNLVDSEATLGLLQQAGLVRVGDPADADVLMLNTCGFLEMAREESIERILQLARHKGEGRARLLAVMGCLVSRAPGELAESLPEVDVWLAAGRHGEIVAALRRAYNRQVHPELRRATDRSGSCKAPQGAFDGFAKRVLLTPRHTAYLKISEGCTNTCSFCSIPLMRGQQRSRHMNDLVEEAGILAARGVRELHLVAQDLTHYGFDLPDKIDLVDLLQHLSEVEGIAWIRLLYAHPKHLTTRMMKQMFHIPKVVPYLDMPIQHASDSILRAMKRPYRAARVRKQLAELRREVPGITLRSTVIVGFPGEGKREFEELRVFLEEARFDRLGIFAYSREPDTPSYDLPGRPRRQTVEERMQLLNDQQLHIAGEAAAARLGQTLQVLVDQKLTPEDILGEALPSWTEGCAFLGRSQGEALDIDGQIFLRCDERSKPAAAGSLVEAQITAADAFDLEARIL